MINALCWGDYDYIKKCFPHVLYVNRVQAIYFATLDQQSEFFENHNMHDGIVTVEYKTGKQCIECEKELDKRK